VDAQDTAPKLQIDEPCGIAVNCCCQLAAAGCATISASGTTSAAVTISRFVTKRVISYSPGNISPSSARTRTMVVAGRKHGTRSRRVALFVG
jgi:hypothetical protein